MHRFDHDSTRDMSVYPAGAVHKGHGVLIVSGEDAELAPGDVFELEHRGKTYACTVQGEPAVESTLRRVRVQFEAKPTAETPPAPPPAE